MARQIQNAIKAGREVEQQAEANRQKRADTSPTAQRAARGDNVPPQTYTTPATADSLKSAIDQSR